MKYRVHYATEADAYLFSALFYSLLEAKKHLHELYDSSAFLVKNQSGTREFVKQSFTIDKLNWREIKARLGEAAVYNVKPQSGGLYFL